MYTQNALLSSLGVGACFFLGPFEGGGAFIERWGGFYREGGAFIERGAY